MVSGFWIQVGLPVLVLAGSGWWAVSAALRRSGRARRRAARWAAFASTCPTRPVTPGAATYALAASPGPTGTVAVEPDGLSVCLDAYPGRPFWLAWASIYSLDPGESGGAVLRLAGGVELHLTAEACRAVWDAKAHVRARPPQAVGVAATAS